MSSWLLADIPSPVITTTSPNNFYALIAGRLERKPEAPLGISVRNGNVMYSTVTDLDGRWALIIKTLDNHVEASSWSMQGGAERSRWVNKTLK
jgi:hypothetical protein